MTPLSATDPKINEFFKKIDPIGNFIKLYFIEILSYKIKMLADILVRFKIDHGRIKHSSGQVQLTLIKNDSLNSLRRNHFQKPDRCNTRKYLL